MARRGIPTTALKEARREIRLAAAFRAALPEPPAASWRLLLPTSSPMAELEQPVASAFEAALERLERAGASVTRAPVAAFDRQQEYFKAGGYAGAEAYYIHRHHLARID